MWKKPQVMKKENLIRGHPKPPTDSKSERPALGLLHSGQFLHCELRPRFYAWPGSLLQGSIQIDGHAALLEDLSLIGAATQNGWGQALTKSVMLVTD